MQDAWPILLDKWLTNDLNAATQIAAELKTRGLGYIEIGDSTTYLKTCRNTSRLRDVVTWPPKTEPALMRASLPARLGQEKLHETQTPQP